VPGARPRPGRQELRPPDGAGPAGPVPGLHELPGQRRRPRGVRGASPVRLADVADGPSHTLLLGEHANREPRWLPAFARFAPDEEGPSYVAGGYAAGPPAYADLPLNDRLPPDAVGAPPAARDTCFVRRVWGFGSDHAGGAHFALCDGSVRFVADTIDPATLAALGTTDGGEVIHDF
jgi:prepilin-type processing-associated H-X9-DG protein